MDSRFAAISREMDARFVAARTEVSRMIGDCKKDIVNWLGSAIAVATTLIIGALQLA